MTECAEPVILPFATPSSPRKEDPQTITSLSYVSTGLHSRGVQLDEVQTEGKGSPTEESFRQTTESFDTQPLTQKNVASYSFPRKNSPSSCSPQNPSPFALHSSCNVNPIPLSSPMRLTPTRDYCLPSGSQAALGLYTTVVTSKEMAAHEASNFKDVKGVYKNCRGIWAAQWTDERGQRHTKYFNPKYYSTEAEARREAFKFKVYIAREVELRGGVQKRRSCGAVTTRLNTVNINDSLLQQSYVQDRVRRTYRNKVSKAAGLRNILERIELEKNGYDMGMAFYNSPSYMSPQQFDAGSPASSPTTSGLMNGLQGLMYPDYVMMPQQQSTQPSYTQFSSQPNSMILHPPVMQGSVSNNQYMSGNTRNFEYEYEGMDHTDLAARNLVPTNNDMNQANTQPTHMASRSQTLRQTGTPLVYTNSAFDPLYFSATPSSMGSSDPNNSMPFCMSPSIPPTSPLQFSKNSNVIGSSITASPPQSTQFCACGCGVLALAPSRYAAHHHGMLTQMAQNLSFPQLVLQKSPPYDYSQSLATFQEVNYVNDKDKRNAGGMGTTLQLDASQHNGCSVEQRSNGGTPKTVKTPVFPVPQEHDNGSHEVSSGSRSTPEYNETSQSKRKEGSGNTSSLTVNPFHALHPRTSNGLFLRGGTTRSPDQDSSDSSMPHRKRVKHNPLSYSQPDDAPHVLGAFQSVSPLKLNTKLDHQPLLEKSQRDFSSAQEQWTSNDEFGTSENSASEDRATSSPENGMDNIFISTHIPSSFNRHCSVMGNAVSNNPPSPLEVQGLQSTSPTGSPSFPPHSMDNCSSFPFAMSWNKCFPLYAAYPTRSVGYQRTVTSSDTMEFQPLSGDPDGRSCSADNEVETLNPRHDTTSGSTDVDVRDVFGVTSLESLSGLPSQCDTTQECLRDDYKSFSTNSKTSTRECVHDEHKAFSADPKTSTLSTSPTITSSCVADTLKEKEHNLSDYHYATYLADQHSSPLSQAQNAPSFGSPTHFLY